MKSNLKYAINYLKNCIQENKNYFDLNVFIKEVSYENTNLFKYFEPLMVSYRIFKDNDNAYGVKYDIWNQVKTQFKLIDCRLDNNFLRKFTIDEVKHDATSINLLSALIELVKEKVRTIIIDIDKDIIDFIQNKVREIIDNE